MVQPCVHHVELCVRDAARTVRKLRRYGLRPFATRENIFCKQVALKLNHVIFIVNETNVDYRTGKIGRDSTTQERVDPLSLMCSRCKDDVEWSGEEHVDTVFNIALNLKNIKSFFSRAAEKLKCDFQKCVIQTPTIIEDEFGKIEFCIIKSLCGNVIHVCLNKDYYNGPFLPGFKILENVDDDMREIDTEDFSSTELSEKKIKENITQIDHITLACHTKHSLQIIEFYKNCFGMKNFSISSNDSENDGLILKDSVGLRLRAMEFYRCYETGLICPSKSKNGERTPNSLMLVVVEPLAGETNCNVKTFLKEHSPGVEHIAFASTDILTTVSAMRYMGVEFRKAPACYYTELRQRPEIKEISGLNFDEIAKLGILLDREEDPELELNGKKKMPKYLMQIFAMPIFERKTLFIEIIQRQGGARGLGAGNIVALIKSIREDERRKAAEAAKSHYQRSTNTSKNLL